MQAQSSTTPPNSDDDASATPTLAEGIVEKSLEDIREPEWDPRIVVSPDERPSEEELDHEKGHKGGDHEPIYIEFAEGDNRNPVNFPLRKKWTITAIACFSTLLASTAASTYNMGFDSMMRDLNCSHLQATAGLSLYTFGFAIVPLVSASFSEEFGRLPLYYASGIGFLLMYLMIALSKNIETVLIARFIQGGFGSTGATMVGGTIADIWSAKDRGLPMSMFSVVAVGGTGLGPVFAGWIEMNTKLEWRWIQWIQMMICAVYLVLLPFCLSETRSSILLTRLAKKIRKKTGNHLYRARVEDERASLRTLIYISCTRPLHLMITEPVVSSFSLWVGFAWGVTYVLIESIAGVFRDLHGFTIGEIGTIFLTMFIGSVIGFLMNIYQDSLYTKNVASRGPEARLYLACVAGILLPSSMFIYAWCSFTFVPWISLAIAVTLYTFATFTIYLSVFSYLADCYGPFASSALAGQSLARNLAATAFPMFTTQMYARLDYKWANTLFGGIAVLMVPIPFILFFFGPKIRASSRFSRTVMEMAASK
ncbi:MFS polyamine transporter [Panaeolus papilionaceus]|nr:MFS polyamine transporter [Panaeolus papilionaceus]